MCPDLHMSLQLLLSKGALTTFSWKTAAFSSGFRKVLDSGKFPRNHSNLLINSKIPNSFLNFTDFLVSAKFHCV